MKKIRNYLLFLLVFIITCALIYCTGQRVQIKKEVDCSPLFEKAKKSLIEGQKHLLRSQRHTLDGANFEFPEKYQCITEDKVVFSILMSIRYFDINVNNFLCTTVSMEVIAERKADKIKFEFEDLVIQSLEICEKGLEKGTRNEN